MLLIHLEGHHPNFMALDLYFLILQMIDLERTWITETGILNAKEDLLRQVYSSTEKYSSKMFLIQE